MWPTIKRLAMLRRGAKPNNVLEAALRKKLSGGGHIVWKTVGPADILTVTNAVAAPAQSLIAHIAPVQDLHGYDSPWPAGGGKNVFGPNTNPNPKHYLSVQGTEPSSNDWEASDYIAVKAETQYTFTPNSEHGSSAVHWYYDAEKNRISYVASRFTTFTTPANCAFMRFSYRTESSNIQLELGTATTYAPYENICPTTGWTGATVYHSGEDTSDPTTIPVTWLSEAGTVYGGTVDLVSGVLTVTKGEIASYSGEALPAAWISDRDVYAAGTTPSIGAQVVYELAMPVTIQLTAQEVSTLAGVNNVWTDCGQTEMTYAAKTSGELDEDQLMLLGAIQQGLVRPGTVSLDGVDLSRLDLSRIDGIGTLDPIDIQPIKPGGIKA